MKKLIAMVFILGCSQFSTVVLADEQSLDDLLGIKSKDKKINKQVTENKVKPKIKLADNAKLKLSQKEASQSFDTVVNQMKEVSLQLNIKKDTSVSTQRTQKAIIAKLDQLIYAMRPKKSKPSIKKSKKQQQGSEGNQKSQDSKGGNKPGHTPPDSESQSGNGSVQGHKAGDIIEQREQWGNLPSRLREELIEGKNEKASPLYRWLAEQYFKALAQEGSKK